MIPALVSFEVAASPARGDLAGVVRAQVEQAREDERGRRRRGAIVPVAHRRVHACAVRRPLHLLEHGEQPAEEVADVGLLLVEGHGDLHRAAGVGVAHEQGFDERVAETRGHAVVRHVDGPQRRSEKLAREGASPERGSEDARSGGRGWVARRATERSDRGDSPVVAIEPEVGGICLERCPQIGHRRHHPVPHDDARPVGAEHGRIERGALDARRRCPGAPRGGDQIGHAIEERGYRLDDGVGLARPVDEDVAVADRHALPVTPLADPLQHPVERGDVALGRRAADRRIGALLEPGEAGRRLVEAHQGGPLRAGHPDAAVEPHGLGDRPRDQATSARRPAAVALSQGRPVGAHRGTLVDEARVALEGEADPFGARPLGPAREGGSRGLPVAEEARHGAGARVARGHRDLLGNLTERGRAAIRVLACAERVTGGVEEKPRSNGEAGPLGKARNGGRQHITAVAHLLDGDQPSVARDTDAHVDAVSLEVGVIEQPLARGELAEGLEHQGRTLVSPLSASTCFIGGTCSSPLRSRASKKSARPRPISTGSKS